ncbi:hypothetical protein [Dyadobacter sp. CY323]|uniref:hypothetical protein n=1 Tax=Dyadobacter sp. CY323 TaxID=2907302 RepID=UPI001F2DB39C|nr:hypothetical protein [Dyadobacter sp. CY323]MCE6992481.1 hypothetical protein [Dyadobacter sp. CY323]
MRKLASAPVAEAADGAKDKKIDTVSEKSLFGKMIDTKKAVKAYLNGELSLSEIQSMGIEIG